MNRDARDKPAHDGSIGLEVMTGLVPAISFKMALTCFADRDPRDASALTSIFDAPPARSRASSTRYGPRMTVKVAQLGMNDRLISQGIGL